MAPALALALVIANGGVASRARRVTRRVGGAYAIRTLLALDNIGASRERSSL